MALNIKNKRTHELVIELAHITGESQAAAITKAVEERLQRVREVKGQQPSLSEKMLAIGADIARRMPEPYKSLDHGEWLYDSSGLPK